MNCQTDEEIFHGIIKKYGNEHQIGIFTEECAEAIFAISKHRRGLAGTNSVVEELADLTIMIEQLKLIYDPIGSEFPPIYNHKIDRIKKLIEVNK